MSNDNATYLTRTNNGTSFSGSDTTIFAVISLATGMRLYAKTGMKPARSWTPTNMLATAGQYTGKKYKRGQFEQAAIDLLAYADMLKATPRT